MVVANKTIKLANDQTVAFRSVEEGDAALLLSIYASTRERELALTNWTPEQRDAFLTMQLNAQHAHYRGKYPDAEYLIISREGRDAGRLYVAETDSELRILDITILPEFRNSGTGGAIVRYLIAQAAILGKPIGIYVEADSPSLSLFQRLGFQIAGEAGYSYYLKLNPLESAASA